MSARCDDATKKENLRAARCRCEEVQEVAIFFISFLHVRFLKKEKNEANRDFLARGTRRRRRHKLPGIHSTWGEPRSVLGAAVCDQQGALRKVPSSCEASPPGEMERAPNSVLADPRHVRCGSGFSFLESVPEAGRVGPGAPL